MFNHFLNSCKKFLVFFVVGFSYLPSLLTVDFSLLESFENINKLTDNFINTYIN